MMLTQLRDIKAEFLVEANTEAQDIEQELKNMDEFQRKKHELNIKFNDVRENIKQLEQLRHGRSSKHPSEAEVRIKNDNWKLIQEGRGLLTELNHVLEKEQKKAAKEAKKKAKENGTTVDEAAEGLMKDLQNRQNLCRMLDKELTDFTQRNTGVSVKMTGLDADVKERFTRNQASVEERRQARQANKDRRRKSSIKNDFKVEIDEDDFRDLKPQSEQVQQFYDQVAVNMQEQDQMLDQISAAMDDLAEMGNDINKSLKFQNDMAPELANKIDAVNLKIESANGRLQDIFEQSGGMMRWCPMCVCGILLLALVGYIVNIIM